MAGRLKVWNAASGTWDYVSASQVKSGTAFPASPITGDQFFRTDIGERCYWNGTYWLGESHWWHNDFSSQSASISPLVRVPLGLGVSGSVFIEVMQTMVYVAAPNAVPDYWAWKLWRMNSAGGYGAQLGTEDNSASQGSGTYVGHSVDINTGFAYGEDVRYAGIELIKVGSPGAWIGQLSLRWRQILG